jgi:putative multiple sugar transport system permease protein
LKEFLKQHLREYGMLLSLVAIMLLFQVLTEGTLLQPLNLTNLVLQNSYIVIMALGMLLVIVAGHIDLSVGSVCGFVGALAAVLMVQQEWHWLPATLVCLVAGGLIGAAQGWFVAWLRIPSFIVTLAGMLVFKGLALALLAGQSVGPFRWWPSAGAHAATSRCTRWRWSPRCCSRCAMPCSQASSSRWPGCWRRTRVCRTCWW